MPTVKDVCRHVRTKNAGPFWITVDLFFKGPQEYEAYVDDPALSAESLKTLYGADPALVKRFPVPSLHMLKLSYPRTSAQGGVVERDLHAGQQYVRLLGLELSR